MADSRASADGRDDAAADRDDTAQSRDVTSRGRAAAADRRDTYADARDQFSRELGADFDARLADLRQDLLDRFTRNENNAIDPDDYPGESPTALARLRAHAEEQRRVAAIDRAAAVQMFDEIHNQLRRMREDRLDATRDRRAAAHDRDAAADDHQAAEHDRDRSLQDRNQAAVERQQPDPSDHPGGDDPPRCRGSTTGSTPR